MINKRIKTGGREVGTPNKTTATLKERVTKLIDKHFDNFDSDIEALEPRDRLSLMVKLFEYVLPKQRENKIDISSLSDNEVDELIERIKNG